jgi:RNA polymerase sigma factor (sigma-70 family)
MRQSECHSPGIAARLSDQQHSAIAGVRRGGSRRPVDEKFLVPESAVADSILLRAPLGCERLVQTAVANMADSKKGFVERLFAQHHAALQAFFYRRIRTKSDAPDLVQEVYVRMLRVSDTEAIRNPELYLFTVASNLVKEHAVLDRRQSSAVDVDEASIQERLGQLPALEGSLDTTQRIARLRVVLAQLPPKCRAAVTLQYRQGLTYQEIADRLEVSPHMVKKYLAHALAHCRRRMAGLG